MAAIFNGAFCTAFNTDAVSPAPPLTIGFPPEDFLWFQRAMKKAHDSTAKQLYPFVSTPTAHKTYEKTWLETELKNAKKRVGLR